MTSNAFIIGLIAGAASALLALSAASGTALSLLLYSLAPAPLLTAMLGWGTRAGVIAAVAAVVLSALLAQASVGSAKLAFVALIIAAPALVAGHFAGLARPATEIGGPQGRIAWFPLGVALFYAFLVIGFGVFALMQMVGMSEEGLREAVGLIVENLRQSNPEAAIGAEEEAALLSGIGTILPGTIALTSALVFTLCLYVALAATRISGRIARPRDDWPVALRMPRPALLAMALLLAGAFVLDGAATRLASALSGALFAGFLMAGLARLHHLTRGKPVRPLLLGATYVALALIALPGLVLFIFGLFDTRPTPPLLSNSRATPFSSST